MISLKWAQYPEADVASFKVYRSIIGFRAPLATGLNTKTLQLKLNGGALQTITFDTGSVVDKINSTLTGGRAYLSDSGTEFLLRSDVRQSPGSVEIVGGTALVDLGLTARVITEKSEDELIATVTAPVDPEALVEFEDPDGTLSDYYALTTVDSMANESSKTNYRQPVTATGPLCVIEGTIINLQGVRMVDAEVTAFLQFPPEDDTMNVGITKDPIKTLSGPDGRFSLPLLQKALVRIEIPAISYTQYITVPEKAYALLNEIPVDLDYQYPPGYRGEM